MPIAPQHFKNDAWNYPARPDPTSTHKNGVVDGDTFDFWLLHSPHSIEPARLRFMHISTAEIRFVKKDSDEYRRGIEHFHFVLDWIENAIEQAEVDNEGWPFLARTDWSTGLRNRYLADIYDYEMNSLADALLAEFGESVRTPEEWHPREPDHS